VTKPNKDCSVVSTASLVQLRAVRLRMLRGSAAPRHRGTPAVTAASKCRRPRAGGRALGVPQDDSSL